MATEILVIGRHEEILSTVLRLINKEPEWHARGATRDEEAIELFHQHKYDLILLGGGIEAESEAKLRSLFSFQDPEITIIQHFGGGSGLLSNEIREALDKKKKSRWSNVNITDNPLN